MTEGSRRHERPTRWTLFSDRGARRTVLPSVASLRVRTRAPGGGQCERLTTTFFYERHVDRGPDGRRPVHSDAPRCTPRDGRDELPTSPCCAPGNGSAGAPWAMRRSCGGPARRRPRQSARLAGASRRHVSDSPLLPTAGGSLTSDPDRRRSTRNSAARWPTGRTLWANTAVAGRCGPAVPSRHTPRSSHADGTTGPPAWLGVAAPRRRCPRAGRQARATQRHAGAQVCDQPPPGRSAVGTSCGGRRDES